MTVRELTKKLKSIKEELQDKEIVVIAKNGLEVPPDIKYKLRSDSFAGNGMPNRTRENVIKIILDYE